MTRLNVLRALVKAFVLFLLFSMAYQIVQPVRTGTLPTLYNHLVNGRERMLWGKQTNLPLMLNDHIIQQANSETWDIVMLGSSETHGDVSPDGTTISALNALGLQTADGRPVRFYNLAMPIGDVWKDLITAELVLQAGLPIDMIVLNAQSYGFQTEYPHPLVIHNPGITATVIDRYHLDPSLFAYTVSKGEQNLWSDRAILSAWFYDQARALAWALAGIDYGNRDEPAAPLMAPVRANTNFPISRGEFLGAFRQMAERYQVDLLIINVPRAVEEDSFNTWLIGQVAEDHVALLDCEFTFDNPGMFFDSIHFMPETYSPYAHILAQHFSRAEMSAVSSAFPVRLPADFAAPEEECVFLPAV